jgi:hypothetical protein
MAIVCWCTAETMVRYALPEGKSVGYFREIVALIGLIAGWRMIGRQATGVRGRGDKIVNGITMGMACALAVAALSIFLHGFYIMIQESLGLAYNSPGKAFTAMMGFVWEDVQTMANVRVLTVLFGGGALAGLLAAIAGRTWR